MFLNDEQAIIEAIIKEDGVTEENCLEGLSDQQVRVWVRYALLGETPEEIMGEVFQNRKYVTESVVRYVLADAQLRIVANLLRDADLLCLGRHRPALREKVHNLIRKVEELKRQKGLKKPWQL